MQNNMEGKEGDAVQALDESMFDMGDNTQKESKSSGESSAKDDRFMKMIEATGNVYDEALRKLAVGEPGDH